MRHPRLSRMLLPQPRGSSFSIVAALFFFLLASYCAAATLPFVQFANASRGIITAQEDGLVGPFDVAVDGSGNLYIADFVMNRVLKETLSNGTYTQTVIASGLNGPAGVAVDTSGNVYIADSANNRVLKETVTPGGYTESTIGSGMAVPYGVSVNVSGNLYVADSNNARILLESPSGGSYIQTTLVSSVSQPFGAVVDAAGNLYIAERGMNQVLKETPVDGGYSQSVITSNVVAPYKVIVDGTGNVYVPDSYENRILKETWNAGSGTYAETVFVGAETPVGLALDKSGNLYLADYGYSGIVKVQTTAPDFGAIAVAGGNPTLVTLTFVFDQSASIGAPVVLTMGAAGLDFQDAGTGTCTSTAYNAGDVCSVDVNFAPLSAGTRNGAVELQDSFGSPLASAYVTGTGVAPQLAFIPGVQTTVASDATAGLSNPVGVAVDGNNNLYVADWANDRVIMLPWSDGAYGSAIGVGAGLSGPTGVTVDGAGNVYIAGYEDNKVWLETVINGNYTQTPIGSGTFEPTGVAVDGMGNVYVADNRNKRALLETPSAGTYTQSVIDSQFTAPYGIAVDGMGNVYVADQGGQIVKDALSNGAYSQSIVASELNEPQGVAVDAAGDVYLANTRNNLLAMLPWNGTTYGTPLTFGTGLISPQSVAFDQAGHLYIGDSNNNRVVEEDFTQSPPLTFGTVTMGQTSNPQTVVVLNPGTAALTFTKILVTSGFNLQTTCSTSTPLPPGSTCSLNMSFAPAAAGTISGTLEIDSTTAAGVNTISLQGVGQLDVATQLAFASSIPTPIANGGNLGTVTVDVLDASGSTVSGSTATVAVQITGPEGFTTYNNSVNAVAGLASFNLSSLALTVAGNYTITASSGGLTSAQGSFVVSPAAATHLAFAFSIPTPIANGGNLGTVTVDVFDASGSTVTGSSATVALQITGPVGFTTYNNSINAVAGVASFDLSGLALTVAGNYTITASSSGLTSAQGSFVVSAAAAFGLSLGSSTLTVASGASGTVNLTISPTGGFTGNIALSCTNLPQYASCSFSPASMNADGSNNSLSSVLTLSTKASTLASNGHGKLPLMFACWSGTALFAMFLFPAAKRNKKRPCLIVVGSLLLLGLLIVLPGCGNLGHTTAAQQTPPGTYSVTLNATSGGTTHSGSLTLTVN